MIFLVVKGLLPSNMVLVFMKLLENLAHKLKQRTLVQNLKCSTRRLEVNPHQQPRKECLQRKSFTPKYGSDNQFFPLMNSVECFICHNFGHVAARCRSRMVQANNHHTETSLAPRHFKRYCFSYNMFGHKAIDFYRRNMKHVRCYACNKFGHIVKECRRKFWAPYEKEKTSSHSKIWKKKEVQSEKCGMA